MHAIVKRLQPSVAQQRLKALVARLAQVTGDLTIQKQRKSTVADAETSPASTRSLFCSSVRAADLKGEIASLIDDDPLWACLDQVFGSVKGPAYS
ncbi:hypothetical protein NKH41_33020 [Mesorhizobium sp. M1169]|uniref:hypothetical protein n=1 Tax=unclassified Mesorhizobium TaxID=325217 RepID=UPI00333AA4A9